MVFSIHRCDASFSFYDLIYINILSQLLWQCEKFLSEILFDSGIKQSAPEIFKSRWSYGPHVPGQPLAKDRKPDLYLGFLADNHANCIRRSRI